MIVGRQAIRADHGERELQHAPDVLQPEAQLPQGADQFQPGHGGGVVQPVAAGAASHRRDRANVGPEPNGAHRQSGAARKLADGEQRSIVLHGRECGPSSGWRRKAEDVRRLRRRRRVGARYSGVGPELGVRDGSQPELAVCEVCGRASSGQRQAHTRASRPGVEAVSTSHAAVGFSSSMEGWRTSGAGRGYWRCLLPPDYMSECPNLRVPKRCIQ